MTDPRPGLESVQRAVPNRTIISIKQAFSQSIQQETGYIYQPPCQIELRNDHWEPQAKERLIMLRFIKKRNKAITCQKAGKQIMSHPREGQLPQCVILFQYSALTMLRLISMFVCSYDNTKQFLLPPRHRSSQCCCQTLIFSSINSPQDRRTHCLVNSLQKRSAIGLAAGRDYHRWYTL